MLCNTEFFSNVNYFKVNDLLPFSIHCMISCTVQANWCLSDNVHNNDNMQLTEAPNQYCWSSKSADLWNRSLNHDLTKSEIQDFVAQSSDPHISVDDCLQKFYSLLNNVGERAGLKRRSIVRKKRRTTKKTWYDCDCKNLYHQIKSLARNIKCNPTNLFLVHKYRSMRKKYVKLLSKKNLLLGKVFLID